MNEARKSGQSFQSEVDIDRHVIYNFPVAFTGLKKSAFEQCYLFEGNVGYSEASETGKNSAADGGLIGVYSANGMVWTIACVLGMVLRSISMGC